ncbi:MAG: putative DNA binding domain-containing protein [Bacteroidales bacterium]|nr:putative DNA binding domain-containing protein [Bacteroidales bacterium]
MALPINIEHLIKRTTVEWERVEFKKGWNPEAVMHTMCAFANDLHNWGGGYIIIGIEEYEGKPVLPPAGLSENSLDKIQREVIKLGHKIQNNYFPIIQPYIFQGKHILILWCPAGDYRYYTAPAKLEKKAEEKYLQQRNAYVRVGSETIVAKGEILRQLHELAARIPFDDRVNHQATIDNFDFGLIREYLQEIKSDLFNESVTMPFTDLVKAMHIVKGPDEYLQPVNAGLLFFSRHPEDFFPYSWIEIVIHKDDSGEQFEESYFKGPLHHQLRNALTFIKSTTIREKVVKVEDRAEANRFFNFPYRALEEALANAVYHKSYERHSPIEVQIWSDKIEILSFPGPLPPVDEEVLKSKRRINNREYRNRRIGDFLKELELTEGRSTGLPVIYKEMEKNGSPKPVFETDTDKSYFLVILPAHIQTSETNEQFIDQSDDAIEQANIIEQPIEILLPRQQKAIDYVRENGSISSKIYQELANVSKRTAINDLQKLVDKQLLKQAGNSKNTAYQLVE